MNSILANAVKVAIRKAIQATKVSVVYDPGGMNIAIDQAGFGEMQIGSEGVDGDLVRVTGDDKRDILVWPSDLVHNSNQVEPEQGAEVVVTLPDETEVTFEVAAEPPEPHWRWTDRFQTARRIHLTRIEVAS